MSPTRLTRDPIDPTVLMAASTDHECGATSLFVGSVRDRNDGRSVEGIEYAAYEVMAAAELERIVDEAEARYPGVRVAVSHRLGQLRVGDVSVAIACSHPHRAPALDAGRYVIEQLKRRVPIWKREMYRDGTREWVDPTRSTLSAPA